MDTDPRLFAAADVSSQAGTFCRSGRIAAQVYVRQLAQCTISTLRILALYLHHVSSRQKTEERHPWLLARTLLKK